MRTKQEEKLLNEVDNLVKAGAKFDLGNGMNGREIKTSFARIERNFVVIGISSNDPLDVITNVLVEAGTLIDKLSDMKAHDKAHPDFFKALEARIYN